jgi:signal peptidase II
VSAEALATGRRGRPALIGVIAAVVVVADQVTKSLAERHLVPEQPRHVVGTLYLDLTLNSGAAFSLGRGVTPVVETVVVVLVVGLLLFGRRAARTATIPVAVGIGLLLGGAAGNLVDRLFRHNHGAVIDFIDILRIGQRDLWPVFNLADAAIVVGAVVLVISYSRKTPDAESADRAGDRA